MLPLCSLCLPFRDHLRPWSDHLITCPTPLSAVINHFITDYERNGRYTGFPALGIEWQKMESPVLRSALGMKVRQGGIEEAWLVVLGWASRGRIWSPLCCAALWA